MLPQPLNPFRYGNPVPPDYFVGRADVLRTIFARIHNGESTAIVGEPHIGKTSFLRYIRDEAVRTAWLGDTAAQFAFIDIDCHLLPASYQPADFWGEVLTRIEETFAQPSIRGQIEVVRQSGYGSFSLKRLFDMIGRDRLRVILLVDEFDVLLNHANFNTAEFFGALRSLAIQTDGLALLCASRMPIAEMNRRSQEINPFGSPFFNNLIEARLLSLQPAEVDALIDQSLAGSDITFAPEDRAYIAHITGRHPFLVQIAAAALFETCIQAKIGAARYAEVDHLVQLSSAAHFEDVWRHLRKDVRRAIMHIALSELPPAEPVGVDLGPLETHDLDMRWLKDGALIELTDSQQHAIWRGSHWRVSAAAFSRWLIDHCKWQDLDPSAGQPALSAEERAERRAALRDQLATMRRRLRVREQQAAKFGPMIPPEVTMEIEDTQREIERIEHELRRLGNSS